MKGTRGDFDSFQDSCSKCRVWVVSSGLATAAGKDADAAILMFVYNIEDIYTSGGFSDAYKY